MAQLVGPLRWANRAEKATSAVAGCRLL